MATPDLFIYYLKDSTGKYYYVDNAGNVQLSVTAKALKMSPTDWYNMQIGIGRDMTYYGIIKKFTVPITFSGDAAKILRYILYTYSSEAYCLYEMDKRKSTDWQHYYYFDAEVDFSTYKDLDDKNMFQVTILQQTLNDIIQTNQNTNYDIPLIIGGFTDPDMINIQMKGVDLKGKENYISQDFDSGYKQFHTATYLPLSFIQHDGDFQVGNGNVVIGNPASTDYSQNYCYQVISNFSGSINLDIPITYYNDGASPDPAKLQIHIYIFTDKTFSTLANAGNTLLWEDAGSITPGAHTSVIAHLTSPYTFDFSAGQYIVVYVDCYDSGSNSNDKYRFVTSETNSSFTIDEVFRISETRTLAFRYIDFAKKLINKVTEGKGTLVSSILSTDTGTTVPKEYYNLNPFNMCVTSGQGLLYQDFDTPVITSSLADMMKDLRRLGLGLGVEGDNVIIEPLSHFFNKDKVICTLDFISSFTRSNANDYMGNIIKVGYPDPSGDQLNMTNEFNAGQEWQPPIKRVQRTLDWTSPYIASTYEIELTRVQTNNSTPTQTDNNNQVFLIYIADDLDPTSGYYYPKVYSSGISGVESSDSIYNIPLSPASTLYWNLPYLKSIITHPSKHTINFQTATKNALLERLIGSSALSYDIKENQNIDISTIATVEALFKPIIFEIQAELPVNILELYDANKNGVIRFWDEETNQYLEGFPIDDMTFPAQGGMTPIQLIASPNTDQSLFI